MLDSQSAKFQVAISDLSQKLHFNKIPVDSCGIQNLSFLISLVTNKTYKKWNYTAIAEYLPSMYNPLWLLSSTILGEEVLVGKKIKPIEVNCLL